MKEQNTAIKSYYGHISLNHIGTEIFGFVLVIEVEELLLYVIICYCTLLGVCHIFLRILNKINQIQ